MAITNTAITSNGTDIFVCPGGTSVQEHAVTCVIFCNVSDSLIVLTLHAVPTGSNVGNVNTIIKNLDIPAGETFTFDTEKMVLKTGDRIHAIASSENALVSTVSSMRVS